MDRPVVLKNIPEADVDRVVRTLEKAGATNIERIKENGTFTVKFNEPDDC